MEKKVRMFVWLKPEIRAKIQEHAKKQSIAEGRKVTIQELIINFIKSL
jgi:hypothetical protein